MSLRVQEDAREIGDRGPQCIGGVRWVRRCAAPASSSLSCWRAGPFFSPQAPQPPGTVHLTNRYPSHPTLSIFLGSQRLEVIIYLGGGQAECSRFRDPRGGGVERVGPAEGLPSLC